MGHQGRLIACSINRLPVSRLRTLFRAKKHKPKEITETKSIAFAFIPGESPVLMMPENAEDREAEIMADQENFVKHVKVMWQVLEPFRKMQSTEEDLYVYKGRKGWIIETTNYAMQLH